MTVTDERTVEERLAALETMLGLRVPAWTDEQAAEFKAEFDRRMGDGKFEHHEVRLLPPGPAIEPLLTPETARALLRECVTVVKPGETLVIRCPDWWGPQQVYEYQRYLNEMTEGFRALAVVGEELAVAASQVTAEGCGCSGQDSGRAGDIT
ncbi:MAG TPA: hypothetical protein VFB06_11345 [Streptosporangiaceae bacterium]|nr:hypothetical protein [Streptosporangiaceae bacterium]